MNVRSAGHFKLKWRMRLYEQVAAIVPDAGLPEIYSRGITKNLPAFLRAACPKNIWPQNNISL